MVLVDVVVTDKQGKPIAGLRPEDFEWKRTAKPQKISTFVPAGENLAAPNLYLQASIRTSRNIVRRAGR